MREKKEAEGYRRIRFMIKRFDLMIDLMIDLMKLNYFIRELWFSFLVLIFELNF